MKSYKVKVNCPDFQIGHILQDECFCFGNRIKCSDYPEIFEEIKEPLFVTDDGVEIHENAEYYPVALFTQLGGNDSFEAFTISAHDCKAVPDSEFKFLNFEKFKFFSTKQAAQKWIEENKPVFSRKQIRGAIGNSEITRGVGITWIRLEQLKNKLGL